MRLRSSPRPCRSRFKIPTDPFGRDYFEHSALADGSCWTLPVRCAGELFHLCIVVRQGWREDVRCVCFRDENNILPAPCTSFGEYITMFQKPVSSSTPGGATGVNAADCPMLKKRCPTVLQYLTSLAWPDGQPRDVGSLVVFARDGLWSVALGDKETDLQLWGGGDTLEAALIALESNLKLPRPDWRKKKGSVKKR